MPCRNVPAGTGTRAPSSFTGFSASGFALVVPFVPCVCEGALGCEGSSGRDAKRASYGDTSTPPRRFASSHAARASSGSFSFRRNSARASVASGSARAGESSNRRAIDRAGSFATS